MQLTKPKKILDTTGGLGHDAFILALLGQKVTVVEKNKGRVFFVSTDQNGIFRVGKFFQVDQGTGTVTFSAT